MDETVAEIVRALRYLHEAVTIARSIALGGEYDEGGLREADEIITRLEAQQFDGSTVTSEGGTASE